MAGLLINRLRGKRKSCFEIGETYIEELIRELKMHREQLAGGGTLNIERYVGVDPIDFCNKTFSSDNYSKYVESSLSGKYYQRLIILVSIIYIAIHVGLSFLINNFIKNNIACMILIGILTIILFLILFYKRSESYNSYYKRTMYRLLFGFYDKFKFSFSNNTLSIEDVKQILTDNYTKKTESNNIMYTASYASGNFCDLELIKTTKIKNKQTGTERTENNTIFDGFYLDLLYQNNFNKLKGNIIKIKDDENILSSLAEDTVKGIYESALEFNFNSEEMNKSFDCKISGYSGFIDEDAIMIEVNKIITPSFEQHLLYLRNRYNSFNMNISDKRLTLSFNMKRDFFQKMKHGELLDFKTTYREAKETVPKLTGDFWGYDDFMYYRIFPVVERLYLVHYLDYLFKSSLDFNYYLDTNSAAITSFEKKMENIYNMSYNEFKKIEKEKIEKINKTYKLNLKNERRG